MPLLVAPDGACDADDAINAHVVVSHGTPAVTDDSDIVDGAASDSNVMEMVSPRQVPLARRSYNA